MKTATLVVGFVLAIILATVLVARMVSKWPTEPSPILTSCDS